tara:strand:+ start:645 stop:932 length:288 start_codon:yes stop_codon:yes gene_type:complete
MEERLERIENKLDTLIKLISEDVKTNCGKMGEHIEFVETVYENVKNPLGYICGKINYLAGSSTTLKLEERKKDTSISSDSEEFEDDNTSLTKVVT